MSNHVPSTSNAKLYVLSPQKVDILLTKGGNIINKVGPYRTLEPINETPQNPLETIPELVAPAHRHTMPITQMAGNGVPPPVNITDREILDRCLQRLVSLYRVYGFDTIKRDMKGKLRSYDYKPTLDHLELLCKEIGGAKAWMKLMKSKIINYFCFYNKVELMKSDFTSQDMPGIVLGGRAHRWAMYLKRTNLPLFMSLVSSIRYSGTAFPRPSAEICQEEVKSTVTALCEPPPPVKFTTLPPNKDSGKNGQLSKMFDPLDRGLTDINRLVLSEETCKAQLVRTTREIFWRARKLSQVSCIDPYLPSTKASSTNSIQGGGALGDILEVLAEYTPGRKSMGDGIKITKADNINVRNNQPYLDYSIIRELGSDEAVNQYIEDWEETFKNFEGELQELDRMSENPTDQKGWVADLKDLENRFRELYKYCLEQAKFESALVVPVALPEPLKVRVITKGPAVTYFVLKRFQKWMWTNMAHQKTFQLIGTPVTSEIVNKTLKSLLDGESWCSGDYKASTNNLKSWVSETIIDALAPIMGLNDDEVQLFKTALTGHVFRHEISENDHRIVYSRQLNGQLMGSIVSFPLLCIANASICRWAIELGEGRDRLLNQCRLLINGDDTVFPTNKPGYDSFKVIAGAHGLSLSDGKSYFTKNFLQINSMEYRLGVVQGPYGPREEYVNVPHLNLGLMTGIGKKAGNSELHAMNIGERFNEFMKQCPEEIRQEAALGFLNHPEHREILDGAQVPWFFPKWLGGLGLDPISERSRSLKDRRRAEAILMNYSLMKPISSIPELSWNLHRKILARIPDDVTTYRTITTGLGDQSIEQNYQRLYSALAVGCMWTSNINDLKSESQKSKADKALQHNQGVWRWALEHCSGGDGLSDWDLVSRKFNYFPKIELSTRKEIEEWFLADSLTQAEKFINNISPVDEDYGTFTNPRSPFYNASPLNDSNRS